MRDWLALEARAATLADGVRIHYRLAGAPDAPAILLVHGYPETALAWRKMVAPLVGAGYRLVMPDLRGAGGSSRPAGGYDKKTLAGDMAAVLDDAGVNGPVLVVGHDIGSMVAHAFARRFADRTRKLVLVDAPQPGTSLFQAVWAGERAWHFHFHQAPDLPEALTAGREALYLERFWHDMAASPDAIEPDAHAAYVRAFTHPGAMRAGFELYRAFGRDAQDVRVWLDAGKLAAPLLVVAGGQGAYAQSLEPMAHELAHDARVEVIARAGHWIAEEQPAALARVIIDFAA